MLDGARGLGIAHLEQEMGLRPKTYADAPRGKQTLFPAVDEILDRYAEQRAFWITGVEQEAILKEARNFVFQYAKEHPGVGEAGEGFEEGLWRALRSWLPVRDAAGRVINRAARSEVVARTNIMDMYNHARGAMMTSNELAGWVEAFRYSAILDQATTPICRALHGKVFTRETVNGYNPPNHFNCRSVLLPVTRLDRGWREELERQAPVDVEPAEGFAAPLGQPPAVPPGKVPVPGEPLRPVAVPGEPRPPRQERPVRVKAGEQVEGMAELPPEVQEGLRRLADEIGEVPRAGLPAAKARLLAERDRLLAEWNAQPVPVGLAMQPWYAALPEAVQERLAARFPAGEVPRGQVAAWIARAREGVRSIEQQIAREAAEAADRIARMQPVGRFRPAEHVQGWEDLPAWLRKKAADFAWRQGELVRGEVAGVLAKVEARIARWQSEGAPPPRARVRLPAEAGPGGMVRVDVRNIVVHKLDARGELRPGGERAFNRWAQPIRDRMLAWAERNYPGGLVPADALEQFKRAYEMEAMAAARAQGLERRYRVVRMGDLVPLDEAAAARIREQAAVAAREQAERVARERAEAEARRQREAAERAERERLRMEAERVRAAEQERLNAVKEQAFAKAQSGSPHESIALSAGARLGDAGVNASYKIDLDDGSRWVFKPVKGERGGASVGRSTVTNEAFTLGQREVLSYRIDRAIGTDMCPEVHFRQVTLPDGKKLGWGSMMRWVENATDGYRFADPLSQADAYRLTVLDIAIGNTDRHGKNWMRVRGTGKAVAIDHGYVFPEGGIGSGPRRGAQGGGDPAGLSELRSAPSRDLKSGDPLGREWRLEVARRCREIDVDRLREAFQTMNDAEAAALKERLRILADALENNTVRELARQWDTGW